MGIHYYFKFRIRKRLFKKKYGVHLDVSYVVLCTINLIHFKCERFADTRFCCSTNTNDFSKAENASS